MPIKETIFLKISENVKIQFKFVIRCLTIKGCRELQLEGHHRKLDSRHRRSRQHHSHIRRKSGNKLARLEIKASEQKKNCFAFYGNRQINKSSFFQVKENTAAFASKLFTHKQTL